jgi:ABC-type sugar transport system ATPase subunit
MTVTLENMTRAVDGIATIRNVSLTLERGTLSVLLGPTLSGKTSIMRLLAGLDKPATGRVLVWQGCHRLRCAAAFGGDGLSAVHQLSLADRL